MVTYEREKKIRVKDKIYVYRYKITEENLGLIRVEEQAGQKKRNAHNDTAQQVKYL